MDVHIIVGRVDVVRWSGVVVVVHAVIMAGMRTSRLSAIIGRAEDLVW